MAKIAIVGAGSMQFTRQIVSDMARFPALRNAQLSLIDIDAQRLETSEGMVRRIGKEAGVEWQIETHHALDDALRSVDYCINAIQVGGMAATEADFRVPAKYGIRQTIADTLGIGGIFRGLRTIPVVLDIAKSLQEQSPNATLLNYTNPMSMVIAAVGKTFPEMHAFGLCHSVHYTAASIANYLEIPLEELRWTSAGINHMAWMLSLEHKGQDMYSALFKQSRNVDIYRRDAVRFELLHRLGYFVTESSEHNAEYTAYFITHPEEIARLNIPIDEYLRRSAAHLEDFSAMQRILEEPSESLLMDPSIEYAPGFINACESGETWWFQGNVVNHGLIDNLPVDACVEVPVLVNQHGAFASRVGALPEPLAALNTQAITVQKLTVEAALTCDRDLVYQAAMLDPQLSATLTLEKIWSLVDDLFDSHQNVLPHYQSRRLWALNQQID